MSRWSGAVDHDDVGGLGRCAVVGRVGGGTRGVGCVGHAPTCSTGRADLPRQRDRRGRRVDLLDVDVGPCAGALPTAHDLVVLDQAVEGLDRVDQGLRCRRATGRVHIDRDDLVDALDDRVVVEHPAGAGADTHRDDPLRLHHLVVHLAQHRRHLLAHPTGDDHDVRLAGAGPEHLHAEPGDVVVRSTGRHHLDRAARETERGRPRGPGAGPVDEVLELAGDHVV